jgi:RNA polymerase I-specific transcription initiation factor RRN6
MSSQWTCFDPILLSIGGLGPQDGAHRIHQLHLANFDYKERGYEDSTQGRNYQDQGVEFYHVTAVLSDLSVRQAIIYNLPTGRTGGALTIELTSWVRTIKRPQCQWKGLVNDLEADIDFVRPDGIVNATEPRLKRPCRPPKSIKRQPFESSRHLFDFDSLYEALHDTGSTLTDDDDAETPMTADVALASGEVKRLLKSGNTQAAPPLGTL